MNVLALEWMLRDPAERPRLHAYAAHLSRACRAGAFADADTAGWDHTPAAVLEDTPATLRLKQALPTPQAVNKTLVCSVFEVPPELSGVCAPALSAVQGPEPAPGLQGARLAAWQRDGKLALPAHWAPNEALTTWIDFSAPVPPEAQVAWRTDLDALEEVVANGPFLGCDEGRYACIGASQVHWLSPTRAQYWLEACATQAPWIELLCNLLFAAHGPAPALRVALTTE